MVLVLPLYDDNPTARVPVVTYGLIGLCVAAFLWELGHDVDDVAYRYGMIPSVLFGTKHLAPGAAVIPAWLTIFTSMFLHAGWVHIGGNMLFLWIFGNNIEEVLGHIRFLLLYFLGGAAAALAEAGADPGSTAPTIGASGAIAAVLGAYLLLYPLANVHVFVWVVVFVRMITVPAWIVLGLWFGIQLVSGIQENDGDVGVAFWAHVGGFIAGLGLLLVLRPRGTPLWQEPRTPSFAAAPPREFAGRRTFHQPFDPERPPSPLGDWGGPWGTR